MPYSKTIWLFLTLPFLLNANFITRQQVIMGTIATISLEKKSEIQNGFTLLKKIELSLSSFNKFAKLYQLNLTKKVHFDNYLLEILQKSEEYHRLTSGYFDITVGTITKDLYGFGEDEKIPSLKQLQDAQIGINGIHIQKDIITLDDIKLDFGGIGKGYGIDVLSRYYHDKNITNGKIGLSGDIRCIDSCTFQIQSPFEPSRTLLSFKSKIKNLSISTSGTYERFIKEQKYHHLINPKTKKQGNAFVSVTILTHKNNTKADALATAVSVMPKDKAIDFLLSQDVGFILVESDKTIISSNLKPFVVSK